jgi:hypothetical protein
VDSEIGVTGEGLEVSVCVEHLDLRGDGNCAESINFLTVSPRTRHARYIAAADS